MTVVLLRRHGGDVGATAVIGRYHGDHAGHGGAAAITLRIGPTRGGTAEVLNMFKVSAVPPRRSAVLTVFRGGTAINDGTTAVPRRSWRCHKRRQVMNLFNHPSTKLIWTPVEMLNMTYNTGRPYYREILYIDK